MYLQKQWLLSGNLYGHRVDGNEFESLQRAWSVGEGKYRD